MPGELIPTSPKTGGLANAELRSIRALVKDAQFPATVAMAEVWSLLHTVKRKLDDWWDPLQSALSDRTKQNPDPANLELQKDALESMHKYYTKPMIDLTSQMQSLLQKIHEMEHGRKVRHELEASKSAEQALTEDVFCTECKTPAVMMCPKCHSVNLVVQPFSRVLSAELINAKPAGDNSDDDDEQDKGQDED